jgi:hypothetical protein
MAAKVFLYVFVTFKVVFTYVTLIRVDLFNRKFRQERPGSLHAVGTFTCSISVVCVLLGTFKVGEHTSAQGTFISDDKRFGRIAQAMHVPLMLAHRNLRAFKIACVAVFVIKVTMVRLIIILGYGNVQFFISSQHEVGCHPSDPRHVLWHK